MTPATRPTAADIHKLRIACRPDHAASITTACSTADKRDPRQPMRQIRYPARSECPLSPPKRTLPFLLSCAPSTALAASAVRREPTHRAANG
jgi:hypothetical protein